MRENLFIQYYNYKIHTKNYILKVPKTWYVYVSKGALSIGEIKFWVKVARGGSHFYKVPQSHWPKLGMIAIENLEKDPIFL